jgi:hypothetical protein
MKEIQYTSYVYSSYKDPSSIEGFRLSKPIDPSLLKKSYPNLRGLWIEFSINDFQPLKINHDEYLDSIIKELNLEELRIEQGRCRKLPDSFWKSNIKRLQIKCTEFSLQAPLGWENKLEELSLNFIGEASDSMITSDTLISLSIQQTQISFEKISQLTQLEYLKIHHVSMNEVFDLSALNKLNYLQLFQIENLKTLIGIESLVSLQTLSLLNIKEFDPFQLFFLLKHLI